MKTILVYYSWSGHTAQLAKAKAEKEGTRLVEVKDSKKPGPLKAYTAGCIAALRMNPAPILPLRVALDDYDKIIIMSPVWAGHPAPAVNSVFTLLPSGKNVEMIMASASGSCRCREKIQACLSAKGCVLASFTNVKS